MKIEGKRRPRRTKCYLIEAVAPDLELEYEYFEGVVNIDIIGVERVVRFPSLAHGPEQAIRYVTGMRDANVISIRRMRCPGLLRAILTPDDEWFDLHRGEIEEGLGL